MSSDAVNVLGTPLQSCCRDPMTGYFRDGYCHTDATDAGLHVVCALVTDDFLAFSARRGNDLQTPRPEFGFPGLQAGDRWCLCAARWSEACHAGCAPPVILEATHESALQVASLKDLKAHAVGPVSL
ncbi:hypothetical protein DFR31_0697 [Alkalispirillum mobile]|uniref:DUF2237 domain-containing protein n=1 Tax=Alkalispirillum mobile TaxID=85925 RepID=A0A498CC46_9GAMM|nr:DUF2237 domain-containing protein [Alkalispirillum mobile]RLK50790.1 hypothetical protein DFR31_0697 [Alkalispirillum mobile]